MSTNGSSKKKSRSSSARKKTTRRESPPIDRPFDPKVLKEAESIARSYRFTVEQCDDGYVGSTVEMSSVIGLGDTPMTAIQETIELLISAIATMIELDQPVPASASSHKRDQQVNIRLSSDEKLRLEEAARREGFRSVSDFIRSAAINRAS